MRKAREGQRLKAHMPAANCTVFSARNIFQIEMQPLEGAVATHTAKRAPDPKRRGGFRHSQHRGTALVFRALILDANFAHLEIINVTTIKSRCRKN